MEEGAVLVQISRELFLAFVADRPRTLLMYLQTVSERPCRLGRPCSRCSCRCQGMVLISSTVTEDHDGDERLCSQKNQLDQTGLMPMA